MADNALLSILHISDFHFSKRKSREQEIVVDALVTDLEGLCIGHRRPDIVLFTGDLVNAAGVDSHLEAYDVFIDKIVAATGCSEERVFVVPGNHDADQIFVKLETDKHKEWRDLANNMERMNEIYNEGEFDQFSNKKFETFRELEQYLSDNNRTYSNAFATVYNISTLNVDIVVLNTAMLSSAGFNLLDGDSEKLLVPEYAIRDALCALTPESFRIFAMHHPFSALSENGARYLRKVIQENADMHLFGHMHDPLTSKIVGFEGELFSNQAGAIFTSRKKSYIGYSLISVDTSLKYFETHLRSYFSDRDEFDDAIDIIKDGRFYSSQESREYWRSVATPVDEESFRAHLLKDCSCALRSEPGHNGIGERDAHDVFVPPPLVKKLLHPAVGDKEQATFEKTVDFEDIVHGDENTIVFALAEHGRTTVLQEIQHRMLCDADKIRYPRLPIFIDFIELKHTAARLLQTVKARSINPENKYDIESLIKLGHVCLMFDDVVFSDAPRMEILRAFVTKYPKARYIFTSLKNSTAPLGAHAVPEMPVYFDMIELCPLKRRQMRQLVTNFHSGKDVETVLDRIQSEIQEINLPFTAANGSILMVIYEEQSGFRPINRSVLIEQFIDITLKKGAAEQSSRETFDYRNKTDLLAHVAAWMAKNDQYIVDIEAVRDVMKGYIDRLGLKADLTVLLNEFFVSRLFVKKADGRLSFRYRAVLEYFIALQMINDSDFKEWVIDEARYLQFINEIQYFAGKLRNDAGLLRLIEGRFDAFLVKMEGDLGKIDLQTISQLRLPRKEGDFSSIRHLSEQLSNQPLSVDERDEELEADIPHDIENRQEVFRPAITNPGQQFLVTLMLYSGVLKNMELIDDTEKRRHLTKVWHGWGCFLHLSLHLASEIAIHRRIRIDGVLYEIAAPHGISNEALARLIALNLPMGVSRLISANLGTEKLEKQLTEPALDEARNPLVFEFFRAALISDLRLPASEHALGAALDVMQSSAYLTEAMIWKIAELRRYDKLSNDKFDKLAPRVATAISVLKGGTSDQRENEKRKQISRLRKEGIIFRMKRAQEPD